MVDEGGVRRLWTPDLLQATLGRSTTIAGRASLQRVLDGRSKAFDSGLEKRVEAVIRCLGPFEVHYQVVLGGRLIIIDLAHLDLRVAVECDGWTVRSRSRGKFDEDRRKANLLTSAGWQLVRVTAAMSDDEIRTAVSAAMLCAARGTA